eukprot:531494_1
MAHEQQQPPHHFPGYQPTYSYQTPIPNGKSRFIELLQTHCLPINKFINEHIQMGVDDLTNLDHSGFVELCTFFKLNPVEKIRFEKLVNELSFGEEQFNQNKASIDTYNHNKTIATSKNESLLIQQLDNEHEKMQYVSKLAQCMMNRTNDRCSLSHDRINKIFDAQKEKILNLLQNKQQKLHDTIRDFQRNQLLFIQNQLKTIDEYQADIRQTRSACSNLLESQQYGDDREDMISQIIQSLLSMHANHNMYRNMKQLNQSLNEISKEVNIEYDPMNLEACIDRLVLVEPVIHDDIKTKIVQIQQLCIPNANMAMSYRQRTRSQVDAMDMYHHHQPMQHANPYHSHVASPHIYPGSPNHSHMNRPPSVASAPVYNNNNPQRMYHHQDLFGDVHHTKRGSYGSYNHFKEQNYIQPRNRPHSFAYNDAKLFDNVSPFSIKPMSMNNINEFNELEIEDNVSSALDSQPPLPQYSPVPPFGSGRNKKAMSFSEVPSSSITHINPSCHSFQIQHRGSSANTDPHSKTRGGFGNMYPPTLTQSHSNHDDDVDIQALLMETIDQKDDESDDEHANSIEAMYEPGTSGNALETRHNVDVSNPKNEDKRMESIDITGPNCLDCNPQEMLNEMAMNELTGKPPFTIDSIASLPPSSGAETRSRPLSIQSESSQHTGKWAVYGVGNNTSYQFGLNHNNIIGDFAQMKWNIDYQLSNPESVDVHDDEEEELKKECIDTRSPIHKTWNDCLTSMTSGPEWTVYLFGGGALYCSGSNASGCFSIGKEKKGTYVQTLTQHPFFESNDIDIRYVSYGCASHHSFVITNRNEVYGIGESSHYQLALDSEEMAKNKTNLWPQKISFFDKIQIARIACGKKFSIFLGEDGVTYSCGSNLFGALGFCDEVTTIKKPRVIVRLQRAKAIEVVCGENHSVILDSNGKVWSFGINNQGQLGRNTKNNLDYPDVVQIGSRKFVAQSQSRMSKIASGANHVAVISESCKLYLWGCNEYGQLGDGTQKARNKAKQLLLKNEVIKDVECGGNHTVMITKERKVFVCGCNEYYQCQQQNMKSNKKHNHRNVIVKPRLFTFENQPDIDQQIQRIFAGHNSTFVAVDTNMDIDRVVCN